MGDTQLPSFEERITKIDRRHRQLARGYVTSVNHDGLVIAEPRKQRRSFPWRGVLLILIGMVAFKGFLYSQIGAVAYQDQVQALANGNIMEKIGSYAMTADPVTVWIADKFQSLTP